jgi:hypothetical protein
VGVMWHLNVGAPAGADGAPAPSSRAGEGPDDVVRLGARPPGRTPQAGAVVRMPRSCPPGDRFPHRRAGHRDQRTQTGSAHSPRSLAAGSLACAAA